MDIIQEGHNSEPSFEIASRNETKQIALLSLSKKLLKIDASWKHNNNFTPLIKTCF